MVKNSKEANKKVGVYLEEKLGASVQLMSEVSSEITYQIPKGLSERFKNFFHDFDKDLDGLGILSYGISVTTLEEVFLSVGHSVAENDKKGKGNSPETIAEINEKEELEDYTIAENPTSLSFGSIFE
jgi:ATP-binding cassette subfamily A (ABC1) protein 3